MPLKDFFSINLPYCLKKNDRDEWIALNREHLPLGWNTSKGSQEFFSDRSFSKFPVYTKYIGLTENVLKRIISDSTKLHKNDQGEIIMIQLYDFETSPINSTAHWEDYFRKIMELSIYERSIK